MQVSPSSITAAPGASATIQVTVSAINGFTGAVSISITGAPAGSTFSPSLPISVAAGTQSITVTVPVNAAPGQFSLTVNGSSGASQHSEPVTLIVQGSQPAAFSVTLNNSTLSVAQGSSVSTFAGLSVNPGSGNSNFSAQFSVVGLPTGVQAAFATNPLTAGQPATLLTFTAGTNAALSNNVAVTIEATRVTDGVQESAPLTFSVSAPSVTLPANRTDFIRMDGTPAAAVYDPVHQLIYASNPQWNRVDIISPANRAVISSIPTPSPAGLDLSPDGSKLLVGSEVEQIVAIDTASLQVTSRANSTRFVQGGATYSIPSLIASAANGTALVGMTLNTDPPSYFLEQWNPKVESFTPRTVPGVSAWVNRIVRNGDGSKILIVDYGTDLNLAVYDSATDGFPSSGESPVGQVLCAAANPSISQFAILGTNGLAIVDAQLNTVATTIAGLSPNGNIFYGAVFSADGTKLYLVNLYSAQIPLVEVYDSQTLAFLGEAPAFQAATPFFAVEPTPNMLATPAAVDSTGRIFSLFSHGIVFEDAANLQNLINSPDIPPLGQIGFANEAPLNVSFPTTLGQVSYATTPDVWFDETQSTDVQTNGPQTTVNAPPAPATRIANVKAVTSDGWFSFTPQAFSYGTEIFYLGGTISSPSGGATLDLFGHGFATNTSVTIGGQPAKIQNVAQYSAETPYPFVGVDHARVTVPAGTSTGADVTISSASGSYTMQKSFRYLPAVTDYPSSDNFTFVLYDPQRHNAYLTAGNHVDVFSGNTLQFLPPIVPPSVSGAIQLFGLALTPDGSKLLIANFADSSVAIVDPDNPASSSVVKIPVSLPNAPGVGSVAATSTGKVFVDGVSGTFSGCGGQIWEIDLNSLKVTQRMDPTLTCLQSGGVQFASDAAGDQILIASPNGGAYLWNASSDTFTRTNLVSNNGAASANGFWFASDTTLLDSKTVQHNTMQPPEYFADSFGINPNGAIFGEKMNASGSLLYAPLFDGVDVFDSNHGSWIGRILLTEQLPLAQNSMALDETGNRLFLITNAGLTVAELGPAPLSIGYLSPQSGPSSGGTNITLYGSGFQAGTSVMLGGASASATFVNNSTLTFTTPAGTSGSARIVIQNSDGTKYSLDAAFVYE